MNQLLKLHIDNIKREKSPVNVSKGPDEATIYLYDIIDPDFGASALAMVSAINQAGDAPTLNIRINSPGGSVFESRAMMAAIKNYKGKTIAHIDSLCASAATSVALSCDEVVMSSGALFMLHNASAFAWGDKTALRETADLLQKIELSIIKDYTDKTGKPDAEIIAMMDAETWLTCDECMENGFIDRIAEGAKKATNAWNLAAFKNAPEAKSTPPPDPANDTPPEPAEAAGFFTSATNQNRLTLLSIQ